MPPDAALPRISVALCTHNGARYVAEQVRSILAQSIPVSEIVLSDDASADDTVEIVSRVVAETQTASVELIVLRNANPLGVTRNFEQAITVASGELVALCDQDDVWHPERLARILAVFSEDPATTLVFSDARLVDGAGAPLRHSLFEALELSAGEKRMLREGRSFEALLRRNLVTGATVVFRRTLLETAAPFPEHWVHDEWLAAIAAATGRIAMLPAELIDYRQHGGNEIGASRLGFAGKVSRVAEPRTQRNVRLLARAGELADRLESLAGAGTASVGEARSKLAHEALRSRLAASRPRRIWPVLRELAGGGYTHYGRGVLDAVRDLLQPAR